MQRVLNFLDQNSPFFFATVDGEQPYVRPFGLAFEFGGRLYFSMGTYKESYRQLQKNPRFEVCAADTEGRWLRIRGTGALDENPALTEAAFAKSPTLKELYNEKTGHKLGFLYLKDGVAEFCDMQGGYERVELHA